MKPKISVIVPVYNVGDYLEKCINSIINQSFDKFEIILVDDGSNDNSGLICDEYSKKDKRIKVIHKENGGVSSARNCGIDNSSGEYIIFVDSDDYIENNQLELLYETIRYNDYDLVYFGYEMEFINKNKVLKVRCKNEIYHSNKEFLKDYEYFRKNYIFGYVWNKMFKSDVIKSNNIYFENNIFPEDLFFTFEVIKKCNKIKSLNYSLYNYVHRDNLTLSKQKKDKYETTNNIYRRTVEFLKQLDCYDINATYVEGTYIDDLINYIYSELMYSDNKLMYKYRKVREISIELSKQNKDYIISNNKLYKISYKLLKFKLIWSSILLYYLYQVYKKLKG